MKNRQRRGSQSQDPGTTQEDEPWEFRVGTDGAYPPGSGDHPRTQNRRVAAATEAAEKSTVGGSLWWGEIWLRDLRREGEGGGICNDGWMDRTGPLAFLSPPPLLYPRRLAPGPRRPPCSLQSLAAFADLMTCPPPGGYHPPTLHCCSLGFIISWFPC